MRSAMASYIAVVGCPEPWFGWAFQRQNNESIRFCLRLLFNWEEARAEDLYEHTHDFSN